MLTHLNKTSVFYRRPSVIEKNIFFVDSQNPLPLFNVEIRSVDTVTWLQHRKGERGSKCENWRLKNSRVQRNRFFSGSVSTAFVHDCRSSVGVFAVPFRERVVLELVPLRGEQKFQATPTEQDLGTS